MSTLTRSYLPTRHLDDASFRRVFEKCWPELMQFRGVKFDFRVVPTLSPQDFVRYQKLPRGDKDIRAMISSYIVHQATAYPHLLEPVVPDLIRRVYRERIREMYTLLVQKVVKRVLAGLGVTRAEAKRLKAGVTRQAWEAYDEAVREFRFHVPYSGRPSPWGLLGILGLAESEQERESFDAFLRSEMAIQLGLANSGEDLRSTDFTPIVFAHYLNERLASWWRRAYPPTPREAPTESLDRPAYRDSEGPALGETIAGASGWQADANVIVREEPAVVGPDGTPYLTIEQVSRQQGVTFKQLRYLETRLCIHFSVKWNQPHLRMYEVTEKSAHCPCTRVRSDTSRRRLTPTPEATGRRRWRPRPWRNVARWCGEFARRGSVPTGVIICWKLCLSGSTPSGRRRESRHPYGHCALPSAV